MQELLAPREVVFYDEGWENIGTRTALQAYVSRATGISNDHLSKPLDASVAAKMSWASQRKTSRPEDVAYSLLGLFEVNMPLLYDEGGLKAFMRLQYEIIRGRWDESIFAWTRPKFFADPPAPGLLAPSPRAFSASGSIIPKNSSVWPPAILHAPRILFDGLTWTLERSFIKTDDRKDNDSEVMLTPNQIPYVAPLNCVRSSDVNAPVKLRMVALFDSPLIRWPSCSLEYFSESERRTLQTTQAESYHLIQQQLPAPSFISYAKFIRKFPPGFTLRLSKSAQKQCSKPRKFGPGVGLHVNRKSREYFLSANEINQDTVGIAMQHKRGAVIKVICEERTDCAGSHNKWRLRMEINTKNFVIEFDCDRNARSSAYESIYLGDRTIVSLEQGHNISVSPKHGLRKGQNTVVICIDFDAAIPDVHGIFDDDVA